MEREATSVNQFKWCTRIPDNSKRLWENPGKIRLIPVNLYSEWLGLNSKKIRFQEFVVGSGKKRPHTPESRRQLRTDQCSWLVFPPRIYRVWMPLSFFGAHFQIAFSGWKNYWIFISKMLSCSSQFSVSCSCLKKNGKDLIIFHETQFESKKISPFSRPVYLCAGHF